MAEGHDWSAQAAAILASVGGGGLLVEITRRVFGARLDAAEIQKLNAEAKRSLDEYVDERIKTILEDDEQTITRLKLDIRDVKQELASVRTELGFARAYIDILRNEMMKGGLTIPPPPPRAAA